MNMQKTVYKSERGQNAFEHVNMTAFVIVSLLVGMIALVVAVLLLGLMSIFALIAIGASVSILAIFWPSHKDGFDWNDKDGIPYMVAQFGTVTVILVINTYLVLL